MQRRFHCLRRCYGTRCPASWTRVPFLEIAAKILAAASSKDSIALLLYRIFFFTGASESRKLFFLNVFLEIFFGKPSLLSFVIFFSSVKRSKLKTGFGGKNRRPPGGEIFVDFRELFLAKSPSKVFFCTKLGTYFCRRFVWIKILGRYGWILNLSIRQVTFGATADLPKLGATGSETGFKTGLQSWRPSRTRPAALPGKARTGP